MQIFHFVFAILWCGILVVITTLSLTSVCVDKLPWDPPYFPEKLNLTRKYIKDFLRDSPIFLKQLNQSFKYMGDAQDWWNLLPEDYCEVLSCGSRNHTMCKYKVRL